MSTPGPRVINSGVNRTWDGYQLYVMPGNSRVCNVWLQWDQPVIILDNRAISLRLHTNNVAWNGQGYPSGLGAIPTFTRYDVTNRISVISSFSGNGLSIPGNEPVLTGRFYSLMDGVYDIVVNGLYLTDAESVEYGQNFAGTFWRYFGSSSSAIRTGGGLANDYAVTINSNDNLIFRNSFNRELANGLPILSFGNSLADTVGGYRRWLDGAGDGAIASDDNFDFLTNFNKTLSWTQ